MKTHFYVYVLFRETGVPLYVGKGARSRWDHAKRAIKGTSHLHNALCDIQERGYEVPKIKVAENLTNDQAKIVEMALIAAIRPRAHRPVNKPNPWWRRLRRSTT